MTLKINEIPIEYCALRFLVQWLARERNLWCKLKQNPSNNNVREALSYFMVARTFPGMRKNPGPVSSQIRQMLLATRQTNYYPVRQVEKLAEKFKRKYNRHNISAASKLLWLSNRGGVVIYDQRALDALKGHFGHRIRARNYNTYDEAWREEFDLVDSRIHKAVEQLPKARLFTPANDLSDKQLSWFATQRWFRERVFDVYLWELGGLKLS